MTTSSPTIPTHLHSPELHVGMPLAALLEKTLESKANDLLPQIMDAVESLRALKPQQGSQSDSGNAQSLTGSQATPSGSTSTSNTTMEPTATSSTSKKEIGTLDLGLPIDIIPGLSAPPKKDPVGGGGEGKTTKPKVKQNDGATLKEGVKGPARPKMAAMSGNKGTAAAKECAKEREKEDSRGAIEKESEIVIGKEKVKMSCKPKNPKEEAKDKTAAGQNKESSDKPQDKATVKSHTGGGKEKDKSGDAKKGGKKDGSEIEPTKTELKSEQKEVSKAGGSKETEDQLAIPAEKEPQDTDIAGSSSRRKQHTPTRRSVRIASISESKEQSKQKESESEEKEKSSSREESDGSEGDAGVEKKRVKQQRRKRRKRLRETDKAPSSGRKKARVLLSSSSEESEREESEADLEKVEESYKSESEAKEEEKKPSKKVKSKSYERRRRRRVHEASQRQPRRSRKRVLPQSQEEDTEPQGQPKRSKIVAASKRSSTTLLKKQFKLKLHRFSSPPMVKTRYNRLVKPNRKYSPAGELSNLESEENSEEQKQEEEEEEEEEEEGEKALSESAEGDNTSEEELPSKPAKAASKTPRKRTKK